MPRATSLEYNAVKKKNRRQAPSKSTTAEFVQLKASERRTLNATVQDQQRNLSLVAWMIRMHLDYVSKFRLTFRSENEGLDKLVHRIFKWHAQPRNFDIAGRLGREEGFRLFEAEKVVNGDAMFIKLDKYLMLQAIESDMIAYPKQNDKNGKPQPIPKVVSDNVHKHDGVQLSKSMPGRIEKFCICNRGDNGKKVNYDHLENAVNCIFDGYFTRFSSQTRGVSPLSVAVTSVQDLCEGVEWNMLKAKAHAIFGLAIMRDYYGADTGAEENASWGEASGVGDTINSSEDPVQPEDPTSQISSTLQDMNPDQMMILDMDTKGKIDVIESSTPSNEFQGFTSIMARMILLAFNIPFSFYDNSKTTFAGQIADLNKYEKSTIEPREKNKWKRQEYSDWLLERIWTDPKWADWNLKKVASEAGITRLRDLQEMVKWVPAGVPWLQKLSEIEGDARAIETGQDNPIDACARHGRDFFENIDKTKKAQDYAENAGVSLFFGSPGARSIVEVENSEADGSGSPQHGTDGGEDE